MGSGDRIMSTFSAKYSAFSPYRLWRRELGFGNPVGAGDAMARSLYCGMKPVATWEYAHGAGTPTGGIFNLEFSPEGTLLVAACEKKSIQLFDPLTQQRIYSVNGGHSDCVNCVKFLDARMFATCSDDTTIAIWDVRNLKRKIRSLLGHSNWVKNIEFSVKDKLLVTSGLDGSIYTWDINSYTECNLVHQRVFNASGLMRCRLSPDARQMVMCTTGGLLVIVHDLNLSTLAHDLHGFKPNLYRLMQMSQQIIPLATTYDHLFDHKRTVNRVEFVSDFPDGNDAEVVSALQIHPQGWSALSRNISHDDKSEWTCIHDIQPADEVSDKSVRDPAAATGRAGRSSRAGRAGPSGGRRPSYPARRLRPRPPAATVAAAVVTAAAAALATITGGGSSNEDSDSSRTEGHSSGGDSETADTDDRTGPRAARTDPAASSRVTAQSNPAANMQNDVWEASITIRQHRMLEEMASRGQVGRNFNMQRIMGINTGIAPPPPPAPRTRPGPGRQNRPSVSVTPSTSGQVPANTVSVEQESPRIRKNRDRLLYYTEETNEGKGFIKELCYSADGRLVCSPFGRGIRLLALNDTCSELSCCVQDVKTPAQMVEVGQSLGIHQDLVVSSKFSPRHHMLVTGCLDGRIVWYRPYSGETLY